MTTRHEPRRTLGERLHDLFHPGPLAWILGLLPQRRHPQPPPHLHGLAEHDIEERQR